MFTACLAHLQKKRRRLALLTPPLALSRAFPVGTQLRKCPPASFLRASGLCRNAHWPLSQSCSSAGRLLPFGVVCRNLPGRMAGAFFFFFLLAGGSYRVSVSRSSSSPSFRPSVVCKKKRNMQNLHQSPSAPICSRLFCF